MSATEIDGRLLREMVAAAARVLEAEKDAVNALNVFPVPDGDTGSNMALTLEAALREVERVQGTEVGPVARALAQGSLMGARGNSGVILSQLFRGFAQRSGSLRTLGPADLARALQDGVDTAYRAVMKPVEGTMLTVARQAARAAGTAARQGRDVGGILEAALAEAEAALARTPEQLPILKKAGVVDSGGKGYTCILRGWLEAVRAVDTAATGAPAGAAADALQDAGAARDRSPATRIAFRLDEEIARIPFPYDTEFFIRGHGIPLDAIRAGLEPLGDSVYVVGSPELAKVHIHTANPGPVLDFCIRYGELIRIEIHNMREQHEDLRARAAEAGGPPDPPDPSGADPQEPGASPGQVAASTAVVAVASGEGIESVFLSLGASRVVAGGQSMNPSTEDILAAIRETGVPVVFVLPNNRNVILAARQAAELAPVEVHVIPTRSVLEGLAAMVAWHPDAGADRLLPAMQRAAEEVESGEVTWAVRDTAVGDLTIRAGDVLGLHGGDIVVTGRDPEEAVKAVVARMVAKRGGEVITLFWGEGTDGTRAQALAADLRALYPDHEVEVHFGGQPLYPYLFGLE
ncbi:DAK2 domain-containing protein [Caldinitratiruptor microaerophilus]|uniref:Dihydroxyacetone kinase n=1 Tax=Caldinitratiruptor microaerophilus TaxID=671077 RepID=A0AA35G635_9FIRM|nr:DAK2 domain-containing protein [Caldinitratiruptor microaerophilus]BDG60646.1 dihydroxyacetone kinase [Caldinitratiruptor microaerophilus]